jgi:hypothetical protein
MSTDHVSNLDIEALYKKTLLELNALVRARGINCSPNYMGCYSYNLLKVETDHYEVRRWVRNDSKVSEDFNNGVEKFAIYSIMAGGGYWYNIYGEDEAKKQVETLNKRHLICALLSNDPKNPVCI